MAHAGRGGERQRREAHGHDEASERHLRGPESQHHAGTARALAQAGQAAGQRVRARCAGAAGRRHRAPQALSALRSSQRRRGKLRRLRGPPPRGQQRLRRAVTASGPARAESRAPAARAGARAHATATAQGPPAALRPLPLARSPARPRAPSAERGREPPCRVRAAAGFGSEPSRCALGPGGSGSRSGDQAGSPEREKSQVCPPRWRLLPVGGGARGESGRQRLHKGKGAGGLR